MHGLTTELAAAQAAISPKYEVTLRAAARSPGGLTGAHPWQQIDALPAALADWNLQTIAHDAAIGDTGLLRLLFSHSEGKLVAQFCAGDDSQSATFTAPAVIEVATFTPAAGIHTPQPALLFVAGNWHANYLLPTGDIMCQTSSDNGATWSSAESVYAGGDAVGDLFAAHLPNDDLRLLHFSVQDGGVRMKGAARAGSNPWQIWPTHTAPEGWLPAGLIPLEQGSGGNMARLFATANEVAPRRHYLGAFDCVVDADGALISRDDEATVLHHVAGEAPIRPAFETVAHGFGGLYHTAQLTGATRAYLAAGPVLGDADMPALLGEALPVHLAPMSAIPFERRTIPIDRGDRTLLVGLSSIWRSVHDTTTCDALPADLIRYRHTVTRSGVGALDLHLKRDSPLAVVQPGFVLWLTRTCRKGADAGTVTLGFVVTGVELNDQAIRMHAVDALGALGQSLTGFHIGDARFDDTRALRALCAWGGMASDVAITLPPEDPPLTDGVHWRVGDSGATTLQRALRKLPLQIWSRTAALGAWSHIRIAAADAEAHYTYGADGHPLVRFAAISDGGAQPLISARGLAVRNRPDEGEDWVLLGVGDAAEPLSPARKPRIVAVEDRNLDSDALAQVADALATRVPPAFTAQLEAQANLALEPHDRISVAGTTYVVHRIVEQWERGRCTQHVELCRS